MVQRKHTRGRRNNRRSRRGGYELETPVEGQPLVSAPAPKQSLGEETKKVGAKVGEIAKGAMGMLSGLFSTSGDESVHSASPPTSSASPETGSLIGGRRMRKHTRKHRKGRKHNKSKRAHRRTSRRNGRSRQRRHRRR